MQHRDNPETPPCHVSSQEHCSPFVVGCGAVQDQGKWGPGSLVLTPPEPRAPLSRLSNWGNGPEEAAVARDPGSLVTHCPAPGPKCAEG